MYSFNPTVLAPFLPIFGCVRTAICDKSRPKEKLRRPAPKLLRPSSPCGLLWSSQLLIRPLSFPLYLLPLNCRPTTPAQFFSWRSLPSGKVPKTVRKGHLWRLPSGISRQRKNVTESRVSLTENRHWLFTDGRNYQERYTASVFSLPSGKISPDSRETSGILLAFPVGQRTVSEISNFPCQCSTVRDEITFPSVRQLSAMK